MRDEKIMEDRRRKKEKGEERKEKEEEEEKKRERRDEEEEEKKRERRDEEEEEKKREGRRNRPKLKGATLLKFLEFYFEFSSFSSTFVKRIFFIYAPARESTRHHISEHFVAPLIFPPSEEAGQSICGLGFATCIADKHFKNYVSKLLSIVGPAIFRRLALHYLQHSAQNLSAIISINFVLPLPLSRPMTSIPNKPPPSLLRSRSFRRVLLHLTANQSKNLQLSFQRPSFSLSGHLSLGSKPSQYWYHSP
ncbi:hypothetical protein OWV82_023170 [Melia azedarach]|uniref:Uncharacterized protein n=1 Tax=Melia azedarach TaxID=155640 RepID=A0ACC1WVJ2_MELAZ|nr:hypothetical protein OWV82_023170 [Melia azedarach]